MVLFFFLFQYIHSYLLLFCTVPLFTFFCFTLFLLLLCLTIGLQETPRMCRNTLQFKFFSLHFYFSKFKLNVKNIIQ